MGEYRFRLPDGWSLDTRHVSSVHVVGIDGIPWPCRVFTEGNTLVVNRNRDESGRTYISIPIGDFGEVTVCTGTLPESPEQYHLFSELARGTLNRLRNQISIWQEGGFQVAPTTNELTAAATAKLGTSILSSDYQTKDDLARESLRLAIQAVFELCNHFGAEIGQFRVANPNEFSPFWFAHRADDGLEFAHSVRQLNFELVEVGTDRMCEPQIQQWADQGIRKKLIVGPLLDASPGGMKQELIQLDDFEARRSKMISNCRSWIEQMPQAAALIHVVGGLNGLGHRHLGYPQQLQLTTDLLTVLEESSLDLPNMVSFEFPWAERLASSVGGIHPMQIADTLLRQGAPIAYLGLEISLDYWPQGSVARDPLQWIDLIDAWSQLGKPLIICLRVPSGDTSPLDSEDRLVNRVRENMVDDQRMDLLKTALPLLIARPAVHGLLMTQWSNQSNPRYPGGGLVAKDGSAKEIVGLIDDIRQQFQGAG